jgi:hypothetical protein
MQRCGWLVLAMCVVVAGCDDDNATAPTNQPLVFATQLSASNEVPPVSNAESVARGAVQITLNATRDSAGAISGATADFYIQIVGLPAGATFVGAHIHPGVAGVNGGVIVNTGVSAGLSPVMENGNATWIIRGITVSPANAEGIANNPSAYYFNVHTLGNPGGVARGQLARVQ